MTLDEMSAFFGWCTVINAGVLLVWTLTFVLARGFVYRLHSSLFKLSEERFDEIHYNLIAFFKLGVFVLNVAPYLALRILH